MGEIKVGMGSRAERKGRREKGKGREGVGGGREGAMMGRSDGAGEEGAMELGGQEPGRRAGPDGAGWKQGSGGEARERVHIRRRKHSSSAMAAGSVLRITHDP